MAVTSPAFKHGQPLPVDYTADGKNVSPPLAWSGLPAGTREIAVIHEDPTAPTPQPFVHWVIYKIPATAKGLPENISADPATPMPADLTGAVQGISGFRRPGYRGPAPPKPGRVHEYHFIVYALGEPPAGRGRPHQGAISRSDEGEDHRPGRDRRHLRTQAPQ